MNDHTYIPKPILWSKCSKNKKNELLKRPTIKNHKNISAKIKNILNKIKKNGDSAIHQLNKILDSVDTKTLRVTEKKIYDANKKINKKTKTAITTAMHNIKKFHKKQKMKNIEIETTPGVKCQQIVIPLNSVGLYIPGGSASLVSTVLMLAVPARIAECQRTILCSPPPISNEILYAAQICGIHEIYQIGGGQAIAAMGFGTESIKKVDKIFGPGNIWVTEAKRQISQDINGTEIDMLAGPSELLIIADISCNPSFVAADLLSQAEHGYDSQVILLTTNEKIANNVKKEINKQIKLLPRYKIIHKSLIHSRLIIVNNISECIDISNQYAPEHLILQIENPKHWVNKIKNAGSIFIGHWSPEAAGDYASGTNHVLPTYGKAKMNSSLSIIDFQKRITIQELSKNGLIKLAPTIITLAEVEKLEGHKNAVNIRLNKIKEKTNEY